MPQHGREQFDPFLLRVHQHGRATQHQVQRHPEVLNRHLGVALAQHAERIALAIPGLRHALGVSLDEIREMVEAKEEKSQLRAETSTDLEPNERRQKLARRLAVTEQQCALIRQKSDQLRALLEEYELRRTRHAAALDALDSQLAAEPESEPTPLAGN